jgi:hypothetical protein
MFDSMSSLAPPKPTDLCGELDRYLMADVEHITDPIMWWYERRVTYPRLSRMALDYLSIPGMYFLIFNHSWYVISNHFACLY